MAEKQGTALSEWLELMLGEISRRQDEAQAADIEQAARASARPQQSTSDEPPRAQSPSPPTASSRARSATRRARGA